MNQFGEHEIHKYSRPPRRTSKKYTYTAAQQMK